MTEFDTAAVLVLAYNRVDVLQKTLDAICREVPNKIYVSIDGPDRTKPNDPTKVKSVNDFLQSYPFPCNFEIMAGETNGGVFDGVLQGIDWFFTQESMGVILEDDVSIAEGSLGLAFQLLKEYEGNDTVGSISLFNPVPGRHLTQPDDSFRFSTLPSSQYWATWENRWDASHHFRTLTPKNRAQLIESLEQIPDVRFRQYWEQSLEVQIDRPTSWEDLWIFTHWLKRWSAVYTNSNYSTHLGFNSDATNSWDKPSWYPEKTESWTGEVRKPESLAIDYKADKWYFNQRFGLSTWKRVKRFIWLRAPKLRHTYLRLRGLR